jgi:hypothetical protein
MRQSSRTNFFGSGHSLLLTLFAYALASLLFSSCRRPFDQTSNVLKIDSLQRLVEQTDATLLLDEDPIGRRNDSMKIKLNTIHERYKDTTNAELNAAIVKYDGIHKSYEDFLKNYPLMEFDLEKHKKTVSEFKDKAISAKMTQDEFDKTYAAEKAFLSTLLEKAKTMTYNTTAIDKDYHRNDPVITKLYHELSKK